MSTRQLSIGATGKTGMGEAITLDLNTLIDTRMLIQANSGGGKSWLLRLLAEQAADKIPTIILDSEGEFASLRERFDMVLVGDRGEIKADTRSATMLARKLIELEVSAVIDVYDLGLDGKREFVKLFLDSLLNLPRSLWHPTLIIIDEAQKFCPEKGTGSAVSTQAVNDLMSLGRKRGFCGVLATQRFTKLHNDAIAEANNVFIGRTWLLDDQDRAGKMLGVRGEEKRDLRQLSQGEFIAFGPALSLSGVTRMRAGKVQTTHPKSGQRHAYTPPKASDAITKIAAQLEDLPQAAEQEARDSETLRAQLAESKRTIAKLERMQPAPAETIIQRVEVPIITPEQLDRFERIANSLEEIKIYVDNLHLTLTQVEDVRTFMLDGVRRLKAASAEPGTYAAIEPRGQHDAPSRFLETMLQKQGNSKIPVNPDSAIHNRPSSAPAADPDLPKGERAILTAIAQYPDGATREQLTILTGYKKSSRDAYIQRLANRDYIRPYPNYCLKATPKGIDALGSDFEPLPTGKDLRDHWLIALPKGEAEILAIVLKCHPDPVHREIITASTDYKKSSRDAYIQRLAARRLVNTDMPGFVRASPHLFD